MSKTMCSLVVESLPFRSLIVLWKSFKLWGQVFATLWTTLCLMVLRCNVLLSPSKEKKEQGGVNEFGTSIPCILWNGPNWSTVSTAMLQSGRKWSTNGRIFWSGWWLTNKTNLSGFYCVTRHNSVFGMQE
eukprot:Lithocolla_globosa_v1_NODE_3258_length_1717_cov_7.506619.p2 type:complete len:130 gc:universal NODE_3258_length_1717_cov_7.506619:572-961(+)